jgi:hypothetical protein
MDRTLFTKYHLLKYSHGGGSGETYVHTHSGYHYYIDGYKTCNRSSQTTEIDIKTTALKNAIEWHWSQTSE